MREPARFIDSRHPLRVQEAHLADHYPYFDLFPGVVQLADEQVSMS
jgi:hypothetical protein